MVLKRKFSILLTMFVCLFALIGLTSCAGSSSSASAYDSLSSDEKLVFDALVMNINDFKDPASVKIVECSDVSGGSVHIKIKATNSFGGTITNWYNLCVEGNDWIPTGYMLEMSVTGHAGKTINIGNLNRALTEYLTDRGLA